jgi:putative membrane protein
MKRTIQGLLLAGSLVLGGAALAQGNVQGSSQGTMQGKSMAQGGVVENMGYKVPADEKAVLERLHHINQEEIQIGRLAQQNGESQDVKSYGNMLVKDHTTADQALTSYAQKKGIKLAEPKPMDEVERKAMAAQKAGMEKLQVLKGQPFDASFLAHMVGGHDAALGKVLAAQKNLTDPGLTPVLQQHAQAITQHRQQAYTLLGRIGPGASAGVGGAGDMDHGMEHDMDKGTGGSGDKNTLDPGSKPKY